MLSYKIQKLLNQNRYIFMLNKRYRKEILLRKMNRIFKLEDENYEIKSDISEKYHRKNYHKLNNL